MYLILLRVVLPVVSVICICHCLIETKRFTASCTNSNKMKCNTGHLYRKVMWELNHWVYYPVKKFKQTKIKHWSILLALVFSHTVHFKLQKVWQKDLTEHCLSWSLNKYFFNDFHNMFWKSPAFAHTHCWLAIKRKPEKKTEPE